VPLLAPLYDGPDQVLTRSCDFLRLQMGDRTDTVSTRCLKPCLDPAAAPATPPRHGHPGGQQKEVTFRWPPVAPPLARLAMLPASTATSTAPARTLAAARPPSPLAPGALTVFPHGQGFFARPDPGQEQEQTHYKYYVHWLESISLFMASILEPPHCAQLISGQWCQ
jgi:hypothetical protein